MRAEGGRLSAAAVIAARRQLAPPPVPWQLRVVPICASTEHELSQWLAQEGSDADLSGVTPLRAVLARQQRFGHGQRGRLWSAPPGGVWISASLPWPTTSASSASLSLAVAVGLALELEALGLAVRIKWPNDLLVANRKIAGLLPRLRLRGGQAVSARVGLGLNGLNRVPPGAINLQQAMNPRQPGPRQTRVRAAIPTAALAARVLRALEWAVQASSEAEAVRRAAEARLLPGAEPVLDQGQAWTPVGLDRDGALRVRHGAQERRLVRTF